MSTVDVYYDYASPFAYIASEVLPAFSERTGVSLRWNPIDLQKLSNYANGLPYSPVKRRYVAIDAARSAEFHGVRIRVPRPHPVPSLAALRLAVMALEDPRFPELHQALFRAAWRDQRDLSDREVLRGCIARVEGPEEDWMSGADLRETGERLATLTSHAESQGVFGVPALLLGGELFWGLDSLPTLEWRLRHPRPAA